MAKRDDLGLREALADRLLPMLVAAMSFLAALGLAGTLASASLAASWQNQASGTLTIQVPQPNDPDISGKSTRLAVVQAALGSTPGVTNPQVMSEADENALLTPWLGENATQLGLQMPAVISASWAGPGAPDALSGALNKIAPGTLVDAGAIWAARVAALTGSLQTCAAAVLVIVALVAAAVVAVAARAGLAQRRDTIAIVHGLGALDGDIADRFASRATLLVVMGAIIGTIAALPVLAWLSALAAPFAGPNGNNALFSLPLPLWLSLPILPLGAAGIGWVTAQITVRRWLRGLP
ncbi:MAG TPA: FtsX-like permease family protein [Acidocella sp.]|jgi:cell division transport system permease protein|nr:FtsX-like permease family protein [Acidocella sp.]